MSKKEVAGPSSLNLDYILALEEDCKYYHPNTVGLTEYEGTATSDKIYPKQNNIIILLLIKTIQKLDKIEKRLEKLEKLEIKPPETCVEELIEKLDNLKIDKKAVKSKEKQFVKNDKQTPFFFGSKQNTDGK